MTQLKNGAKIIHETRVDPDLRVVLAVRHVGSYEYVTWSVDKWGNAYLGHYFTDFFDAVEDYKIRARRERS